MTIRRFLHCFMRNGSDRYRVADEITDPSVSCRPSMHQPIEEPDTVAFTDEDQEFMRQLGIACPDRTAREHLELTHENRSATQARA